MGPGGARRRWQAPAGPGASPVVRRRWQASAFAPVLANQVLRRLLPALAVSAIGDGMSAVGVAWLIVSPGGGLSPRRPLLAWWWR